MQYTSQYNASFWCSVPMQLYYVKKPDEKTPRGVIPLDVSAEQYSAVQYSTVRYTCEQAGLLSSAVPSRRLLKHGPCGALEWKLTLSSICGLSLSGLHR